jgi:hypothetical protein
MHDLVVVPRDSLPPSFGERGYVSDLMPSFRGRPGLALAMTCCRDLDAGTGLAQLLQRVPVTHVAPVSRLADRQLALAVMCACGEAQIARDDLTECSGACGRWFMADGGVAWVVRLPAQEAA